MFERNPFSQVSSLLQKVGYIAAGTGVIRLGFAKHADGGGRGKGTSAFTGADWGMGLQSLTQAWGN